MSANYLVLAPHGANLTRLYNTAPVSETDLNAVAWAYYTFEKGPLNDRALDFHEAHCAKFNPKQLLIDELEALQERGIQEYWDYNYGDDESESVAWDLYYQDIKTLQDRIANFNLTATQPKEQS